MFVTGIAGFLGSHVAEALLKAGHEVTGIDSLVGGLHKNVPVRVDWVIGDCRDLSKSKFHRDFLRETDVVVHCAALAYEGLSVFSPSLVVDNVVPHGRTRADAKVAKSDVCILHWGIMSLEDAAFHKKRWDDIYTRKVGNNPYGGYDYYFDPKTVAAVDEVPLDRIVKEYL